MGYESKVLIVEKKEIETGSGEPIVYANIIAEYDLCKMGWRADPFYKAFKTPIEYKLYLPGADEQGNEMIVETDEDCYGEHMKAASLPELADALRKINDEDPYRRIPPLLAMVEAFCENIEEWREKSEVRGVKTQIEAVHFGY